MPGVRVKTLGGPGSISTVSINGGPTSQTKVTLNGFDLSSMQTGVTDLSQLPTAFIDEARIITSGHKLMRSGSQNGVLELNTWKPNNSLSFSPILITVKVYMVNFRGNQNYFTPLLSSAKGMTLGIFW